jgi:hypothetical protein
VGGGRIALENSTTYNLISFHSSIRLQAVEARAEAERREFFSWRQRLSRQIEELSENIAMKEDLIK